MIRYSGLERYERITQIAGIALIITAAAFYVAPNFYDIYNDKSLEDRVENGKIETTK